MRGTGVDEPQKKRSNTQGRRWIKGVGRVVLMSAHLILIWRKISCHPTFGICEGIRTCTIGFCGVLRHNRRGSAVRRSSRG